ncbi:UDP-N-acetylmuramate--alanine ligase [Arcanobacterium wilhelmae]|uniref:UDP-N-acetylmuramate--L-alanine ligase n=1 Tax=Arcanobacterium wilhelmae TaxID=1803177 RepID=A0ABT9N969_9ACTO|nr:UDP-N-acetylmuramate--L-alanine ligase [Arcanobacterium wilhelmae]MDP9800248.1 UDP-N-acetylmuramate--alanine ligase [Arcanobacterium wilhelmae]WFN89687.1 UDP-N-acetylmuramate--L-alanine ligase [Arcanobacterium wilhelmae]
MKFHLIGIGGAGMSVVAELLLAQGAEVSGSDRSESANTRTLQAAGARVFIGHDGANVYPEAVLVVSSAIKDSNPELAVARSRGQRVLHRSQALALAAGDRDFIAVAGAHGKTTTSGMLASALGELGLDPSRAVGSTLAGGEPGGYLGTGSMLVAEADESDGSFLNYSPRVAIVTNVEPDHLDHYGTREAFEEAFAEFARRIVPGGLLVACADNDGSMRLARVAASEGIRVVTYGRGEGLERHVKVSDVDTPGGLASGVFEFAGESFPVSLHVAGAHNLLNAAAVWSAGVELGVEGAAMARALGAFRGTGRRFELRGEVGGIRVIDDYAHHPTEVEATLATARTVTDGRVLVLFQPHLYSRTRNFASRFAEALSHADTVVVTSVYAAREVPSDGDEADVIVAHLPSARFIPEMTEAAHTIAAEALPGDLVITMGAGSVTKMADVIISDLEAQ